VSILTKLLGLLKALPAQFYLALFLLAVGFWSGYAYAGKLDAERLAKAKATVADRDSAILNLQHTLEVVEADSTDKASQLESAARLYADIQHRLALAEQAVPVKPNLPVATAIHDTVWVHDSIALAGKDSTQAPTAQEVATACNGYVNALRGAWANCEIRAETYRLLYTAEAKKDTALLKEIQGYHPRLFNIMLGVIGTNSTITPFAAGTLQFGRLGVFAGYEAIYQSPEVKWSPVFGGTYRLLSP